MTTTNINCKTKLLYTAPVIECIKLDNQISLALESTPPEGPNEAMLPKYLNNDPFKQLM